ncbi:MAG: hypothetical protein WCX79_00660 [Candidatus Paceibacterota bacterium]|jgi:hypothetical protein
MITFPLCPTQLYDGIIIGVNADTLKVKLPDGRVATVKIKGDEFEATYEGEYE